MNEDRRRAWMLGCLPAGCGLSLMVAGLVLILALFLIKWLWAWTVPDLLPRAVEEGYVARDISWWTAAKLALFLAVLAGVIGIRRGND
ncbi:MAG: hypothetical protein KatS3mg115_1200 [Candidatus Poribacteria bacterium]|nr:MAG: hypothetical protein KatS3mg115_1200 [Candidatus Poribacteria bacterium]